MKHPRYEVLQDYFENVLNPVQEKLVKEHLLDCDECTQVLAQFTTIETKIKNQKEINVSDVTKKKIFADAQRLLSAKAEKRQAAIELAQKKAEKIQSWKEHFEDWKENILPEIKVPALQVASISLMLLVFIKVEKIQSSEEEVFEPIKSEVQVYTFKDVPQKVEEE